MNSEEIQKMYQELETLTVKLERSPQRGLSYLHEKMLECREKQDRVGDLLLKVNRVRAGIRRSIRGLKAAIEISAVGENAQQLSEVRNELRTWEDQEDEVRYLSEVILSKQSNLRMTSSDIRLLCSVVEQQIKAGEIVPRRHEGNPMSKEQPTPPTGNEPGIAQINEVVPQTDLNSPDPVDSEAPSSVLSIEQFLASDEAESK